MKHTPGPWEIRTDNDGTHIVGGDRFYDIAKVVIESTDTAAHYETQANARLIAAAPEMYEALKAIASFRRNMTNESLENIGGINDGRDRAIKLTGCIEIAEALLAKVEG
jgi:hypothetical protein